MAVLIPLSFYCLLYGHDDRIRGARLSVYVECRDCGRRSRGISLRPAAASAYRPGPAPLQLILKRIGTTARTIVKVTRLLGGLLTFAHAGRGRA